jgi:hypothetical protein
METDPKVNQVVDTDDDSAIVIGNEQLDEVEKLMKATLDSNKEELNGVDNIDELEDYTIAEAKRLANRPVIDHFENALNELNVPKFKVGDRIIVEMVMKNDRWLETRTGSVKAINLETGDVSLHDEDIRQGFYTNFKTGVTRGYRFKLVPTGKLNVSLVKRRGRPRKGPEKPVKPVELDANGKPIKRKRGRPKGIKNRPKDVVNAEKLEKDKVRDAKRALKQAKKRGLKIR